MSEELELTSVISRLLRADNILILCHKNPDGDTLGSAGALYWALAGLGKTAAVFCADEVPRRYDYMQLHHFTGQFDPAFIVAVDIAGTQLFGDAAAQWAERVDLCIDHHGSNSGYADASWIDENAAATCELIFELVRAMGVKLDVRMANCLYTGLATDTGCFRFSNTTARTHQVAAALFEAGAETGKLNELLFLNKSKQRIAIEQMALSTLEYHFDARCALVCITRDDIGRIGAAEADLEGVTAIPRSIEGVLVGITLRQQPGGSFKISVRTKTGIDAVAICAGLGGGGHRQAAGCEIIGGLENAKAAILAETRRVLDAAAEEEAPA